MRGDHVRELQLMLRHNPYGTFDPGEPEGAYDLRTASAVRRAKYWLGYPEPEIDEFADTTLRELLAGGVLPTTYAELRDKRLNRAETTLLWDAALTVAREELGRRERNVDSKRVPATLWYGILCPWSVVFPCYCYAQAGSIAFHSGLRYAYAPYLLDDARRGHHFLSVTEEPLRGDIALIDHDKDGIADRAALFDGWTGDESMFDAIEGDIGLEGELSGSGAVARSKRGRADAVAFVHVRA
jgi:hypothetical protein